MEYHHQIGACSICGAPIYIDSGVWMGIIPPPSRYTCTCNLTNKQFIKTYVWEEILPKVTTKLELPKPMSKVEIIKRLRHYQKDVTSKADDAAFEAVIEWFVNCTPDYKET
jgi:hypothetical protein